MVNGQKGKQRDESALAKPASAGSDAFPWERRTDLGESVQAYARFLAYRDMGPVDRSLRKVASTCGISDTLVNRWSKRWSWLRRAQGYDAWMLELSDGLGKHAAMVHRRRLALLSSAQLDKANEAIAKLKVNKHVGVSEIVALSKMGLSLGDAAYGMTSHQPVAPVQLTVGTSVQFGNGQRPSWIESSEAKQNEIVVPNGEQVLAEYSAAQATRSNPATGGDKLLPPAGPRTVNRLKERLVEAPKRVAD